MKISPAFGEGAGNRNKSDLQRRFIPIIVATLGKVLGGFKPYPILCKMVKLKTFYELMSNIFMICLLPRPDRK